MDGKKDFNISLLNNVKKRKELWDKTSEDYKKMQKKEIAWVEIAIEIGKSEDICRATWKKLRNNFLRYYKLEKRYRYQDEISFIIPHIKTSKSGNTVPIVEISDSDNYSSEDESHNDVSFTDENSISSSHNRRSITTTGIHQEVVCEPEFDVKPNMSILPDYPETLFVDEDNPYNNDNDDNEANEEVNEVNEVNEDNDTNEYVEKNDNNVSSAVQSTSNENVNSKKRKLPAKGKIKGNTNKKVQLSSSSSSATKDDHPMLLFFKSVLPDVTSLPAHKQRLFRKHVLHVIDCLYADVPNPE